MGNDQWKNDGDCGRCRRQSYCGTKCKASRERIKKMQAEAFKEIMAGFLRENAAFKSKAEKEEIANGTFKGD